VKKKDSHEPKDIRVEMKFKNNLILAMMEEAGFKTVAELSRAVKVGQNSLGKLINMRILPTKRDGSWAIAVTRLADFFKRSPEDLFSEFQQEHALEKNCTYAELYFSEVQALLAEDQAQLLDPVTAMEVHEQHGILEGMLSTLTPREQKVLRARFGFDGPEMTLEEIAKATDVTRERIRQVEAGALRKLRVFFLENPQIKESLCIE